MENALYSHFLQADWIRIWREGPETYLLPSLITGSHVIEADLCFILVISVRLSLYQGYNFITFQIFSFSNYSPPIRHDCVSSQNPRSPLLLLLLLSISSARTQLWPLKKIQVKNRQQFSQAMAPKARSNSSLFWCQVSINQFLWELVLNYFSSVQFTL